jgi:hypothetical protein
LTLHRTPECPPQVAVDLDLSPGAHGITMSPARFTGGQSTAVVFVSFARDAALPEGERLKFRARGLHGGYPVEAAASVDAEIGPPNVRVSSSRPAGARS